MIKLEDVRHREFILLKARARDYYFFAKRSALNVAIREFKKGLFANVDISSNNGRGFVACPRVSISKAGFLNLGCHRFNPKTSRIIIRWAAGK